MFEAVELGQTLAKADFKAEEPNIRAELLRLQRELADEKIATLIIVAGVEGGGKGEVVNRLNKWFDNRGIETHAFWDETDDELARPHDWRFWKRLPARGSIAVMFGGWYWEPLHHYMSGQYDEAELDESSRRINELEQMLHQDGLLIVKLWFHLSEKVHQKRMKKRREVELHVRGHSENKKNDNHYSEFLKGAERVLRYTDTADSAWQLIEADDKWFRDLSVARALSEVMENRLHEHRVSDRRALVHDSVIAIDDNPVTILDKIDVGLALERKEYDEQLDYYQSRLHELSWKAYDAKKSMVAVFEGWDAAGKGGVIRRLTTAMDARLYRVISIASPTDEERAHHYLWRFWRQIPRDGYITIYDRSWYGRVLVERVEEFAESYEWMRAYQEINDFEEQLTEHGSIVLKFWLHISPDEQLARFKEREQTKWKKHKITEEDWRNREKWDDYKQAVNTMVAHTSTGNAPWELVPANNKLYARIEVLKRVCLKLAQELDVKL